MRVNTAIVRSRSRYSSMSRLMKVPSALAVRYSGSSRSTTSSTISSKAHIDRWLTMAETLTET